MVLQDLGRERTEEGGGGGCDVISFAVRGRRRMIGYSTCCLVCTSNAQIPNRPLQDDLIMKVPGTQVLHVWRTCFVL